MDDEILTCSVDDFIEHYLPFLPAPQWVDVALEHLATEGQLIIANAGSNYVWNAYRKPPSETGQKKEKVFGHLKDIIDKLAKVDCPRRTRNARMRVFSYKGCPNHFMKGEISGGDYKVDAIMTSNPASTDPISAETALIMEFRKENARVTMAHVSFSLLNILKTALHSVAEPL